MSLRPLKEQLTHSITAVYDSEGVFGADSSASPLLSEWKKSSQQDTGRKADATFVFLCRNSELQGVVDTIQQIENRFNKKYWVLLNEEPFTSVFKRWVYRVLLGLRLCLRRVSVLTDSPISFGTIPKEHWHQPNWINEEVATAGWKVLQMHMIYAGLFPTKS